MKRYLRAFTVVECVIVIAIIAILAAILIPFFTQLVAKASESAEQQTMRNLSQQLMLEQDLIGGEDDVLEFLDRNGGAAFPSSDSVLGWNEETGGFLLFDRDFRLVYGENNFNQRSVWLFIPRWAVAEDALNAGYAFQYYHIGGSSDEAASLAFSYNARISARAGSVFGGLTVSYRSDESSSVRIAVSLSAPGAVLSVFLPNAEVRFFGDAASASSEVAVCARNFLMTGNIGGRLCLERTAAELSESAVCRTVTGDASSSILNGGQIFKLSKSISRAGNAPTVLFDSAEWLATVSDSLTLREVLSDVASEPASVALSLDLCGDVSLSAPSGSLVFNRKVSIALNGHVLSCDVPLVFGQDAEIFGGKGTLSFSSDGKYSGIAAMQCDGEFYASQLDIAIGGMEGIVLNGGGIWEEVLLNSRDSSCALTVRNFPSRLTGCGIYAQAGSALAVEGAILTLEAVQLSGDSGSGIIVSGGELMLSGACWVSGAEDGITVIGADRASVRLESAEYDGTKIIGRQNGISFSEFTGELSIRIKNAVIEGTKQYGVKGYDSASAVLSIEGEVKGGIAGYSWK